MVNINMDEKTLKALLKEAKTNYKYHSKLFVETDNAEAMHETDTWETVINWLENKLDKS